MIKIILEWGQVYTGTSEKDLIHQLQLEDWTEYPHVEEYKWNIKRRIRNFSGEEISYSNDREFLEELQRVGFIREIIDL